MSKQETSLQVFGNGLRVVQAPVVDIGITVIAECEKHQIVCRHDVSNGGKAVRIFVPEGYTPRCYIDNQSIEPINIRYADEYSDKLRPSDGLNLVWPQENFVQELSLVWSRGECSFLLDVRVGL